MIPLSRPAKPSVLARNEAKWRNRLASAATDEQEKKALARYNQPEVREALWEMCNGKCAYCERQLDDSDAHIEHYRPKANPQYRHLAFEWTNLLLSCSTCNSSRYKGDKFPEATDGGPIIDPSGEDPGAHLQFVFDPAAGTASVYGSTTRGNTTVQVLGLNRQKLRRKRTQWVTYLALIREKAREGDATAAQLFREAQADGAPYAAFARALAGN